MNCWSGENALNYRVDGNQAYQGKGKLWLYNNGALNQTAYQKVTGLENGVYTVKAMGFNLLNACKNYIKIKDSEILIKKLALQYYLF